MKRIERLGKLAVLAGVGLFLATSVGSAIAATSPSNRWKFNEATAGSAAVDSVGSNPGTAFGNPSPQPSSDVAYTTPANSGSMQFDGQNYFEIANPLSADFTICAWIKTLSTGGDQHWVGANIVDAETGGFALDYGFGINNEGKLMFGNGGILNGSEADANTMGNTVIADNTWHEVCVTRNNATGENILYVDGNQDATGFTGTGLVNSNSLARIASGTDGAAPFVGLIDDLRFFQSVVPAAEIAARFAVDEVIYQNDVSLANTGSDFSGLLVSAGAMILLGAGSMVYARRKTS